MYIIILIAFTVGQTVLGVAVKCSPWSEWSGECDIEYCGLCNMQERNRTVPEELSDDSVEYRQCANRACENPCAPCAAECTSQSFDGTQSCIRKGYVPRVGIDGYKTFLNCTESPTEKKICPVELQCPGLWTEWSGSCDMQYCGLCNIQTRNGTLSPGTEHLFSNSEYRTCNNPVCYYPCGSCVAGCNAGIHDGEHVCLRNGLTARPGIDGYKNFLNWTKNPKEGYNCPEALEKVCSPWSEWSGECQPNFCGLCNLQTRNRTVPAGLTDPDYEWRQCLNIVCLYPCVVCAPECFKGISRQIGKFVCQRRGYVQRTDIDGYWNFMNASDYLEPAKYCPPFLNSTKT